MLKFSCEKKMCSSAEGTYAVTRSEGPHLAGKTRYLSFLDEDEALCFPNLVKITQAQKPCKDEATESPENKENPNKADEKLGASALELR